MRSVPFRKPALLASLGPALLALLLTGCVTPADDTESRATSPAAAGRSAESASQTASAETGAAETTPEAERVLLEYGDESEQVRELQARLAQLGHFTQHPTGYFGDVTLGAVSEYQRAAGLEISGKVDESTWAELVGQTGQPTEAELFPPRQVMGYGDQSEQVRELQARLAQLGHFTQHPTGYYGEITAASVTAFQEASGLAADGTVDEDTWAALTAATRQPTHEELYPPARLPDAVPAQDLDDRCLTGRVMCISKTTRTLSWVIDGEVQLTVEVRFGAAETPTREGVFEVYWKSRHHHSTLYDSPMPYAMFFDGGQAVHYSADFAANGYNGASHGCVNVRDEQAIARLFDEVHEGDGVVVHW